MAGPVPNVGAAMQLIDDGGIGAALLDIAIGNEKSLPTAERLKRGGVPFAFLTGYSDGNILESLKPALLIGKPAQPALLLKAVSQLLTAR